jgi:exonuclease SbcC
MRLLGVEATDFLSWRRLDVDLSDVHQLAIIGKNGHGKSAILDAILWCLFAKGRGSSDEMVRDGAGSTYVRTTWERIVKEMSTTVTITRSRSRDSDESSLSVQVDGEERTKARIPQTQAYIEHLVGMGPKAMMAGPVMVQGDSAALLEALPAARKDLLVELFQLERWEGYHEEAKRRRKMLQRELDLTLGELEHIESNLEDFDEVALQAELSMMREDLVRETSALERLREYVTTLREQAAVLQERARRASSLSDEADAALQDLDRVQALRRTVNNQIIVARSRSTASIPDVPREPDNSSIEVIQRQIEALDESINQLKANRAAAQQLRRQRAALAERAAATSPCEGNPPGCQYLLLAKEAQDQVDEIDVRLALLPEAGFDAEQTKRAHLVVDLRAAEKDVKAGRSEHYRLSTEAATLTAQRDSALEYLSTSIPQASALQQQAEALRERHDSLTAEKLRLMQDEYAMEALAEKITAITFEGTGAKGRVDELTSAIQTAESYRDEMRKVLARRTLLSAEQVELDARATTLDILIKAFHRDGIPTLILETALPEIESRANDVLARLPDDYSIRLDTKAATKAGTFKDELRVTVMTGGKERPYHMLSGGQRFRVDFAVRIALAAVIASRVEATVDTLWLDEPLGPLDREGQEAVADTLSAVADDFGLIAVVSHVPDFSDRMASQLLVSMEDGESYAVLA